MERIFEKYDDYIIRSQYKTYEATSETNFNRDGGVITFDIDGLDSFLNIKHAKYTIRGKYLKNNNTEYEANSNIQLDDNFVAFLFSQIEVTKGGTLIDQIENVGRSSIIKGCVSYSLDANGPTINSGFQSRFKGGGRFEAVGNLSNFCLGFFKDIKHPIFRGGFKINFKRAKDDDALFRWATTTTTAPDAGKVIIEEFKIIIPTIEYKEMQKVLLTKELTTLSENKEYMLSFKSWQCMEEANLIGKTYRRNISNFYRHNYEKPLFAIIGFQTNSLETQLKRASCFEHCNVKNIWIEMDEQRYPQESLNLDWKNEKFSIVYDMYTAYKKTFHRTHQELPLMYLSPNDLKTSRPMYVLNLTRRLENVSGNRNNIVLNVEFNEDVPTGTICYICLVSNSEFEYDVLSNTIRKITTT